MGICLGSLEPSKLIKAKILNIKTDPCQHKTYIYPLINPPPGIDHQTQVVYQPCQLNELHSLNKRHLVFHKWPKEQLVNEAIQHTKQLLKDGENVQPITPMEYAMTRKGAKRRRYQQAAEELDYYGMKPSATNVTAFIKIEKWDREVAMVKSPRMIQYRHPTYVSTIASRLYPFEEKLWETERNGCRVFAKGLDSYQTAAQLRMKWERCDRPIAIMKDFSKFDSCITLPWIKGEKEIYELTGTMDEMDYQFNNTCSTVNGVSYKCEARKMSGEYNTSCGDSIVNWSATDKAFHMITGHYRYYPNINGDDDVMIVDESEIGDIEEFLPKLIENLELLGFKTDASYTRTFEEIEFCQSQPVEVESNIWRMIRKPARAISRDCYSVRKYGGTAWYRLAASLGYCEYALNDGVPVLQSWAKYLQRSSKGKKVLNQEIEYRVKVEIKNKTKYRTTIDPVARESFAIAFGIEPTQQIAIESWLDNQESPELLPYSEGYWG
ncbi:hypothetical protein 2 [Hubei tombus-like virus 23]|uniref:hypothetical protein 2 n=1 Tax=Hubei tombus-like virus 23 TaxID=1923270 RepID=UPI00090B3066|nr:hypothetical protein 2 [Hubei tombus-like virus 23]APG76537.1 hypothetical protein 2 [Hubei tombus-like virus 23]